MVRIGVKMKIRQRLEIAKAVALVTYKEWSAYRTHSMVSIFVGPIYFIVQYFIWTSVYGSRDNLHGMELQQMLTYFGATALIGYLTMDFADWNLQMLVRTGRFLTFALRPIHHRFFALCQKFGHRVLGFFFEFLPCFFIFQYIFKVNMIPEYIGWTLLSIIFAFLMNFYVNYCIGMTAFWLVQSSGIRRVFQVLSGIFSGAVIPLVFFPEFLQKLLFFLPFQYITYVPSMVFSGSYTLAGMTMSIPHIVMLQGTAVVITALFSEVLYRKSMHVFTAVGG
jgi:ABC-2 type transport system permease protein